MSCSVFALRSTSARVVIISLTNSPPAWPGSRAGAMASRHKRRKAVLVMPAIGARTTGGSATTRPESRSGELVRVVMASAAGELRGEVALHLVETDAFLGHR